VVASCALTVSDHRLFSSRSKSVNTPFLDKTLQGRVEMVIAGKVVLLDR
jgi:dihydroorotase-like cyclic amidohydrolase